MARDLRYMKLGRGPGSTWFFVYGIPKDLRGRPRFMTSRGKPMTKITESLGTTDPEKAAEVRNRKVDYWTRQFRIMRDGPSEDDIREEAVEVYRAALAEEPNKTSNEAGLWSAIGPHLPLLDYAIAQQVAAEIAARFGQDLQPGTEPYRKVGTKFIEARIAAGVFGAWLPLPDGRILWGAEQNMPRPEPPVPSAPIAAPPKRGDAETFSEAAEKFITTELDGTRADTVIEYRRKVKMFIDKIGDLPLSKITDHTAVAFLDEYLLGERKQKPMTRNSYAMLFKAIYKCAIRRKKATTNPFEGQRIKQTAIHYQPFTDQEITALFADAKFEIAPAKHKTATALPWASLISAFTGCRLEEVAQLKAADIKQTDGIWYFEFCHDSNGKTEAATRTVPLHRALIDAGLLQYRDALPPGSMLFPGLKGRKSKGGKLGPRLSDAFNAWREKLGIVRPGVTFHSFRHSVGDRLRKAGVQESDIAAVLGHEDERITSRVYGHDGPGLHRLQAIVAKIKY